MLGKDRIEGDLISINKKLLPLSWLYGLGVGFRNLLFEMGILKSRSFSTPVISVGNITVGGTGKTPHVAISVRPVVLCWPVTMRPSAPSATNLTR